MRVRQYCIFILGSIALLALFFMLPESPGVGCASCSSKDPYIPLIGSGYFALLIAMSLLFPSFPRPSVGWCGFVWAILLAATMTYFNFPAWCFLCLTGHACNILIWTIWNFSSGRSIPVGFGAVSMRVCIACITPLAVVALFAVLNLTFMVYGFEFRLSKTLRPGDEAPSFAMQTTGGRLIDNQSVSSQGGIAIHFISADCPYCKEQMQVLNEVVKEIGSQSIPIVNVSAIIRPGWSRYSNLTDWVEDKEGELRRLFAVTGYPTLIRIDANGKIASIISGVPDNAKPALTEVLLKQSDPIGDIESQDSSITDPAVVNLADSVPDEKEAGKDGFEAKHPAASNE